jgi:hypothetical protein
MWLPELRITPTFVRQRIKADKYAKDISLDLGVLFVLTWRMVPGPLAGRCE